MTKRVQILGHDAETAAQFVGLEREITVDTDNKDLHLHDGVSPGGQMIYNRDQNDERYQGRSVELDGLTTFEPNQRGLLTRLGPSNYRLRVIEVNAGELVIANDDGHDGNPYIELAPIITTDHRWDGSQTYTATIHAEGGVVGDLQGNVLGNLVGNVSGNVVGNLTGNANGSHTGSMTGDVDVRGHTFHTDPGQIHLASLNADVIAAIVNAGLPVGSVIAYAGSIGSIPLNWFLCDGTNGTPDLRDRFIVATGPTYPVSTTGGTEVHSHTSTVDSGGNHNHSGAADGHAISTAEMPTHHHSNGVNDGQPAELFCYGYVAAGPAGSHYDPDSRSPGTAAYQGITSDVGSGNAHAHTLTIDVGGAHTHTGSTADAGTLPPYYSMYYIMKGS